METVKTVTIIKTVKVDRPLTVRDLLERERVLLRQLRDHRRQTYQDLDVISDAELEALDEQAHARLRSPDERTRRQGAAWLDTRETHRMCLDKGFTRFYVDDAPDHTGVRRRRLGLTDLGTQLADKLPNPPRW